MLFQNTFASNYSSKIRQTLKTKLAHLNQLNGDNVVNYNQLSIQTWLNAILHKKKRKKQSKILKKVYNIREHLRLTITLVRFIKEKRI